LNVKKIQFEAPRFASDSRFTRQHVTYTRRAHLCASKHCWSHAAFNDWH